AWTPPSKTPSISISIDDTLVPRDTSVSRRGMSTWLQRLGLWTSCLAQLIVVLDVSVVNVALPSIQADLGLTGVAASWLALAYSLGFAGLLLVGASMADVEIGRASCRGRAYAGV